MTRQDYRAVLKGGVAILSLGAIAYGAWLAWPPAGFLVPGLLLWIDLSLGAGHGRDAEREGGGIRKDDVRGQ